MGFFRVKNEAARAAFKRQRQRILGVLASEYLTCAQIATAVSMSQPRVNNYLQLLENEGLVQTRLVVPDRLKHINTLKRIKAYRRRPVDVSPGS